MLYIYFDDPSASLGIIKPPELLTNLAKQAIEYAPEWLRIALADNFSRINSSYQDIYANLILKAQDPYVDEIAFTVDNLASQTLQSSEMDTNLLIENAEYVYKNDTCPDYVAIIDSGSASSGGNYYSTTSYYIQENSDTFEYTLPKEIYYWFIVHPKLHKELPAYINPSTGNPADPPTGVFWRNYLFNHADVGYLLLIEQFGWHQTLWNCIQNDIDNGAISVITQ